MMGGSDRPRQGALLQKPPVIWCKEQFTVAKFIAVCRPTVCLDVTSLVASSYGYDSGKIGPTRCALIGGRLGDK
jgi:hypothetical protein